jgi:tetratricopeptide (TPR) repeat protein
MLKPVLLKRPFHFLIIITLGLLVYSNTFSSPFVFDDEINIVANPINKDLGYFARPSSAKSFRGPVEYPALLKRYMGHLSFALNYRLHGLDVTGYHVVNLAIHLINGGLVYLLVVLTFRTPRLENSQLRQSAGGIALMSALLFVCHPVQTQAVTYIVQRLASMAAMFYLGSAYRAQGLIEKAIEHYTTALELDPNRASTHNNLGNIHYSEGMLDKAIGHYRVALRIDQKFAIVHNNLGVAYIDKGLYDKAVLHLRTAIILRPELEKTRESLKRANRLIQIRKDIGSSG